MGKRRIAAAVMVAVMAGMSGAALAAPAALPTMEEITKLVEGGQWKEALASIARVSELKGTAAAPYDRPKLLLLKAECQLQQHENVGAIATLNVAKKEAKDAREAAEPTALIELLQKSVGGNYTPKEAGKSPISVLDREKRKDAYTALANDELAALQTQTKNAASATTLPPLVALGKATAPARAAELAGTGKTDRTDALTAQLAAQAQKLMNGALGELSKRVEAVSTSANRQIAINVPMGYGRGQAAPVQQIRPQGLTASDIQTLKDVEKQCDQFTPAVKDLGMAFGDEKGFAGVGAQATQVKARAEAVMNANYEGSGIGAPFQVR